eukprot:GEMP01061594.1.p2 GENE.GEMP01061594.1~~GEMP01061594.1.p2  ORF type:complete len:116 (-),score=14.81 GEMP01061594.1:346-693(-)
MATRTATAWCRLLPAISTSVFSSSTVFILLLGVLGPGAESTRLLLSPSTAFHPSQRQSGHAWSTGLRHLHWQVLLHRSLAAHGGRESEQQNIRTSQVVFCLRSIIMMDILQCLPG